MRSISAAELEEWRAFDRISPIGDERADLQAGIIASTVFNCTPGRKGKGKGPREFMPLLKRLSSTGETLSKNLRAAFMQFPKTKKPTRKKAS